MGFFSSGGARLDADVATPPPGPSGCRLPVFSADIAPYSVYRCQPAGAFFYASEKNFAPHHPFRVIGQTRTSFWNLAQNSIEPA
jgi:hypothetical protein